MKDVKPMSMPLAEHFKLNDKLSISSNKEKKVMKNIPYTLFVGRLLYATMCKRMDIAHATSVVSIYLANLRKQHWEARKWILRYLRGTYKVFLCFRNSTAMVEGYTDSNIVGDLDRRSLHLVTIEAKYIATIESCKEMLWLKHFLVELGLKKKEYVIRCDSQSTLDMSKNPTFHSRSKHIDVQCHWIRYVLGNGLMKIKKIHVDQNLSNIMKKIVPKEKHKLCKSLAGMNVM